MLKEILFTKGVYGRSITYNPYNMNMKRVCVIMSLLFFFMIRTAKKRSFYFVNTINV